MLNPITTTIAKLPKKIDRLYLGFIFCDITKVSIATTIANYNSNTYVLGFLSKKDWSIIFSITFA